MGLLRAVGIGALATALSACGQSLFDADVGDPDAAPTISDPDAGAIAPLSCEAPCVGDAVADFDGSATGSSGRWRYLADPRDRTWAPLAAAVYDGIEGFTAGVDDPVAVADCREASSDPRCAPMPSSLLLVVPADRRAEPALELSVPDAGPVAISARVRLASGEAATVQIYRNTREDLLLSEPVATGALAQIDGTFQAVAGDRLLLALGAAGDGAVVANVQLVISSGGDDRCELTLTFEETLGVDERCGRFEFSIQFFDGMSEGEIPSFVAQPSVIPELGSSMVFDASTYLLPNSGPALRYDQDFTVQAWVRSDAPESTSILGDSDSFSDPPNGFKLFLNQGPGGLLGGALQLPGGGVAEVTAIWPDDGGWHFVRVVRSGSNLALCVDGEHKGDATIGEPPAAATEELRIGRTAFGLTWLTGQLDEVRALGRALPCER